MSIDNQNKKGLHIPAWIQCNQLPVATSAVSGFCAGEGDNQRYVYYMVGNALYRYDTYSDGSAVQLATCPATASTALRMKYSSWTGFRTNVLGASSTTLTTASVANGALVGKTLRIVAGTGAGQTNTVTADGGIVVYDNGTTSSVTTTSITDSTKKWKINQWVGYQLRITYGTGASSIANILYNTDVSLTISDPNYQQLDPRNNTAFTLTLASGCTYQIEAATLTMENSRTITPDRTSTVLYETGGIFLLAPNASTISYTGFYDVLRDKRYTKTMMGSYYAAAIPADIGIDRTGKKGGAILSGTASGGTTTTLTVGSTLDVNKYKNMELYITGGTGIGQSVRIMGNTTNAFYVNPLQPFAIAPDATSTYIVYGHRSDLYMVGGTRANIMLHDIEYDVWTQHRNLDFGTTCNYAVKFAGQEPFGISSATRYTTGITSVNAAPTAGGTLYVVGDVLTVSTGGTNGRVRVEAVGVGGVVTSVSLYTCGSGYTTGAGKATTGGTGSGCTINIATVGTVCTIATASSHNLAIGDAITLSGFSEAAYNGANTVLGTNSVTTFDIATSATANGTATNSQSTTVVVDSTKNRPVNALAGKLLLIQTAGYNGATQIKKITSNTATTITVPTITAATNGTSRYVIMQPEALGRELLWKSPSESNTGFATGGTASTLVDTSRAWKGDMWKNHKMYVISGTGRDKGEITITGNDATTLNLSSPGFTPDTTTQYIIMDTFGTATAGSTTTLTDSTKNRPTNRLIGKYVAITAGTGLIQYLAITANTATQLTFATATAPDTTSTYTILGMNTRGTTAVEINWIYGCTMNPGKYMLIVRGGATNTIDRYDINSDVLEAQIMTTPQTEVLSTGSNITYDGGTKLYMTVIKNTSYSSIMMLNCDTGIIDSMGLVPRPNGTAIIGNRFEVITTPDLQPVMYLAQCTGNQLWRCPITWL